MFVIDGPGSAGSKMVPMQSVNAMFGKKTHPASLTA